MDLEIFVCEIDKRSPVFGLRRFHYIRMNVYMICRAN